MNLRKKYRKMLALILALAITVSGVMVNFPAKDGEVVQFGGEVEATETTVAFEQQWDNQPYTTNQTNIVSNANGILKLYSTSNDPWLQMNNIGKFDPYTYRYIEVRYRIPWGASTGYEICYLTEFDSVPNEDKVVKAEAKLIADKQWHTHRLDMWKSPNYRKLGKITGWRYDWTYTNGSTIEFDYIKLVSNDDTAVSTPKWETKTPRNGEYSYGIYAGSTAVTIGGKIYVYGGYEYTGYNTYVSSLSVYDPVFDSWTHLPVSGPRGRAYHCATVIDGKMYISGGQGHYSDSSTTPTSFSDTWMYDPATNIWEQKAVMPHSMINATAVTMNGKMYVFGGAMYIYDPANNTWASGTSNSTVARSNHTAVVINGMMYVCGGYNQENWMFNPTNNSWTKKEDCPVFRTGASAVVMNGKMYMFGGNSAGGPGGTDTVSNETYSYDPNFNTWTQEQNGIAARDEHAAAVVAGRSMYIFDGTKKYGVQYQVGNTWRYDINKYPIRNIISPSASESFSAADTNFIPQISVSDADNDTLTCKYYIDSEYTARDTKTVSNTSIAKNVSFTPLNMNSLSEDIHTIRYEIDDGYSIEPLTKTVSFKVDKTKPTIGTVNTTSTTNTITMSGSATDSFSGLAATPYRYTIGSGVSAWGTEPTFTSSNNLAPNTKYTVKFEAIDAAGNIASQSNEIYTKATAPILAVSNATSYTLDVKTSDNNPDYTQYQIKVSNNNETKYVTQEGNVTATPVWITLTNKAIKVKGLNPDSVYTFSAKARNMENIETAISAPVSGTTLVAPVAPPTNIIATATDNTIKLAWDAVSGAISYDIVVDKAVDEITAGDIINVTSNEYTQSGFYPGTPHTFLIRSRNEGDPGVWSSKITKSTLPSDPSVPANLNAVPLTTSVTVVWNNVPGATGYDIQYDWDNENDEKNIVSIGPNTSYVHSSLTPGKSHIYRVRSINAGGKSEWSELIETSTLVEAVPVPVNVKAEPTKTSIILTWDAVAGATGYTIEVDGEKYDISKNTYIHSNLSSDTKPHIYSVRANRNGRSSDWSSSIVAYTLVDKFGTPVNFKTSSDDSSVSLSWDSVKDAISYEIQRNNVTIDNITETSCIDNGLSQNETYTYRVRAISESGFSAFTSPLVIRLKELSTPKNLDATSDENSIFISWEPVNGATAYDVEFDDLIETVSTTTYSAIKLISGSQHKIRVMARNENGGTSSWSTPFLKSTVFAMGDVPNVSAITKKNSITVMWNSINGATGYDVEVNGNVISNVTGSAITFRDLPAETKYEYRVSALNSTDTGSWSNMLTVFTLPEGPSVPSNVKAAAAMTSILVTWDNVAGATEYELSITDLNTNEESRIQIGSGNSYLHTGLAPDRTFKYKVKAKNISGESNWSAETTMSTLSSEQTFKISSVTGEVFDLVLSASNIQDISSYSFRVQYNTEDYDVIDLCGLTAKLDTQTGDIAGTDISVNYVAPGTIVFVKTGSVNSWQVWSGIVNTIKLKAKRDGEATITYSMQ